MQNDSVEIRRSVSQTIDFYKIFKVFLSRWYWILGCIVIALAIAKINILYTKPVYMTSSSLMLKDGNPSLGTSQMSSQVYNYTDKIQAESYVIKSNDVILNAISNLDYKISYYVIGRINTTELYPNKPFAIDVTQQDSVNFNRGLYQVEDIDGRTFSIISADNPKGLAKTYAYGETLRMGNMSFRITNRIPPKSKYSFKFNTREDFIGRILSGLSVNEAARFTNVMSLSQSDGNAHFAADILNSIMKEYIKYDLIQKRRSAKQTVDFIDNQLNFIDLEANKSGNSLASYKTENKIVDLTSATATTVNKLSDLEKQKSVLNIEQLGINQLEKQLNSNYNKIEINLDLEGSMGNMLSELVSKLNDLIISRQTKLTQFNPNSQPIKDIESQISNIKQSIRNNIRSLKQGNINQIRYIENQISTVNQALSTIPAKEQKFVKLTTNFEVNNKVRSYLSEKKLEAEMNAAAVVPGAAIVNLAYPSYNSINSGAGKIYSYALLLGTAAGVGLIMLVRFLNPYIYDKETVEALTNTPIIGVIRKFPEYIDKDNRQALSLSKPKSIFAESVRSVRTNLSFMASHKQSKTICITSEVSGEGKSFVTVNLAGTLALIDKRVILIAGDLRKSKLHKVFGSDNKKGLSSFLSGKEALEDILIHDNVHNIDFIPSGPVPPNPSELLHTEKMKHLLEILAPKYDYVLIDTAPVGLVSDSIPLIRQSDVNLFVIRSGKSQLRAANIPERLSREYGLSNLAIVLNAFGDDALHSNYYTTDYSRGGGNGTYYYSDYSGYTGSGYYDEDPKKWWQFWKKK